MLLNPSNDGITLCDKATVSMGCIYRDSTEVPRDAGPLVSHYLLLVLFYTHYLLFLQCPGFSAEML